MWCIYECVTSVLIPVIHWAAHCLKKKTYREKHTFQCIILALNTFKISFQSFQKSKSQVPHLRVRICCITTAQITADSLMKFLEGRVRYFTDLKWDVNLNSSINSKNSMNLKKKSQNRSGKILLIKLITNKKSCFKIAATKLKIVFWPFLHRVQISIYHL